jgi:hypothetical protein
MDEISNIQFYSVLVIIILLYILNGLLLIGYTGKASKYIADIDFYFKIYISLYIIYRFNRFRKVRFTDLDRMIMFTAGTFLFATTIIHAILITYLDEIKKWLENRFHIKMPANMGNLSG